MTNNFGLVAIVTVAFSVASAARSNAGTDMIIDNSAQAPPPRVYNYAPPPPPVIYYAPPPVRVVVAPTYYYARPVRVFGYHRAYVHRPYWRHDHGR